MAVVLPASISVPQLPPLETGPPTGPEFLPQQLLKQGSVLLYDLHLT